jgi:aminoglycoside 3-N-acetyltransferase
MHTKEEIKEQLKTMGILPTDTVVIHTSMKAIGSVEGGPEGLLDAFCEYLSEGLFLVPTHTWDDVTENNPYFDVRTAVPNIGLIPVTAAKRKDGVRSLHPTHSMWAYGADAAEYVKGEENAPSPTPAGYCWDKLADVHAKILLIGVENDKNTFIHAIEERLNLPDRISDKPYDITITDGQGNVTTHPFYQQYCSKTEDISWFFGNFEKPMVEMGVQTLGKLGDATVRIVDAMGCRQLLTTIFQRAKEDIFAQHIELPQELYR